MKLHLKEMSPGNIQCHPNGAVNDLILFQSFIKFHPKIIYKLFNVFEDESFPGVRDRRKCGRVNFYKSEGRHRVIYIALASALGIKCDL